MHLRNQSSTILLTTDACVPQGIFRNIETGTIRYDVRDVMGCSKETGVQYICIDNYLPEWSLPSQFTASSSMDSFVGEEERIESSVIIEQDEWEMWQSIESVFFSIGSTCSPWWWNLKYSMNSRNKGYGIVYVSFYQTMHNLDVNMHLFAEFLLYWVVLYAGKSFCNVSLEWWVANRIEVIRFKVHWRDVIIVIFIVDGPLDIAERNE